MKVGFVILNFNSWKMTRYLAQKTASFENINAVVVVDNVSTDDSYGHLKKLKNEKIHIVQTDKNGGYSYGNNYGAGICEKLGIDIMFISNPDVDVEEEDIGKILNCFANREYSVLSGVEYDHNKKQVHPPLWRMHSYRDDFLDCFFIGRKFLRSNAGIELDENVEVQDAEMIKGSFLAVRLKDFIAVGGFDPEVFLYCEERILARKITDIGGKIGIVTGAKYIHNHTASICNEYKTVSRCMRILFRSRLYYNKKYNQIGQFQYVLLVCAMKISILEYSICDCLFHKLRLL